MMRSAIWYACVWLAGALTVGTTDVRAQTTHNDVDAWTSLFVAVPIGERLEIRADGILQVTNGVSRVGWELARVVLVGTLNDRLAVGGGYTWFRVEDGTGSHSVEHRAVQELDLRVPIGVNAVVISLRSRLEERRREQQPATAFRLRQQTRLDMRLGARGVRGIAWNEYFFAINGTEWSGRSGPSLMLNFVGLHVPMIKRTAIEPGYLNQTVFVAGRNHMHHVVALFVAARL